MFDWFKEAAIKKGMSNIRNDTEKLIEAANILENRFSDTGYVHVYDLNKIKQIQSSLKKNIEWAIKVDVPTDIIMAQIHSVVIRINVSEKAQESLGHVIQKLFRNL